MDIGLLYRALISARWTGRSGERHTAARAPAAHHAARRQALLSRPMRRPPIVRQATLDAHPQAGGRAYARLAGRIPGRGCGTRTARWTGEHVSPADAAR